VTYWNYRLCKETGKNEYTVLSIREVYYNKENQVEAVTEDSLDLDLTLDKEQTTEDGKDEIKNMLEMMLRDCFSKGILDLDTITYAKTLGEPDE